MSNRVNEADRAEAVKGRTLDEVAADVALAVSELQTLRAEQGSLVAIRRAAEEEQAPWLFAEIDERASEVRVLVDAAQARLCRLYAERARLQLPEADGQAEETRSEYERAHAEYLRAYEMVNRLGVESDNASMRATRLRQSVADNVRQALELERTLPPRLRGAAVRQS